jgi:hypothetical protein
MFLYDAKCLLTFGFTGLAALALAQRVPENVATATFSGMTRG